MINSSLFVSTFIFSTLCFAGPLAVDTDGIEVGNGGFIVQCPIPDEKNGFVESSEFFDYYEYKKEHPEWSIPSSFMDHMYYDTALKILKNYSRIDEFSATSLTNYSMTWYVLEQTQTTLSLILNDQYYKTQALIPAPTPYIDSELLKNCKTKQIISFAKNNTNNYEYRILPDLFASLDTVNQAIAMIHEINYLDQIKSSDNSPLYPNVIRQTQFIFSLPDLEGATTETILDWQAKNSSVRQINRLEFSQYGKYKLRLRKPAAEMPEKILSNQDYINAYWFPLYRLYLSPNGKRIENAFLEPITLKDKSTGLNVYVGGRTQFHENGEIEESELKVPLFFNNSFCFSKANFTTSGDLESCK